MLNIQENIPLAPYTTFKIGGLSRYFAIAKSAEDIREAAAWAGEYSIPVFILGNGSNILISDKGLDGLTIKIELMDVTTEQDRLIVGAGVPMARVVVEALKQGLVGFEWAVGVPGTIGGSVRGNAGCYGGETKDVLRCVEIFDCQQQDTRVIRNEDCGFQYRESVFKKRPDWIVLEATFKLKKGNEEDLAKARTWVAEMSKSRVAEQDIGARTAGSTFKGVPSTPEMIAHIQKHDKRWKKHENASWVFANRRGFISAGFLIELAGLKGKKVGDIMVSPKHANFIVNTGNGTAEQVIMLIGIIKEHVHRKFGVQLEEEIQYVGF